MKIFATALAASMMITAPAFAQLSSNAGSTANGALGTGTSSSSMPGVGSGGLNSPSSTLGSTSSPLGQTTSPAGSPLSAGPGSGPVNPLGRTPSSIPSGVGAELNQDSTASGLSSPGSSATDAGRPAGVPLGSDDPN